MSKSNLKNLEKFKLTKFYCGNKHFRSLSSPLYYLLPFSFDSQKEVSYCKNLVI